MQEVNQEFGRPAFPEKDLFRGYEIRNWQFSTRIYKILAVSAIVNIVSLFVFVQGNLLTKKGCDSPFVRTVCQVIDTVYVGSTIFGADTEYSDIEFDPTKLAEDTEITFIDTTGQAPPLSYPTGYFAVANPDDFVTDSNGEKVHISQVPNPLIPGMENPASVNAQPDLANVTPNYPEVNNNPLRGERPKSPFSIGDNPTVNDPTTAKNGKNLPNDSPGKLPDLGGGTVADGQPEKTPEKPPVNSDPVEEIKTNKRPFKELAEFVSAKWAFQPGKTDNKIDLKPFKVILNGKLTKKMVVGENGEQTEVIAFDDKKSKWVPVKPEEAGDAQMVEIAKEAVEAVGDSGFLGHLYNLGLKDVKITLIQVDGQIVARMESEQPSEERARSLASGLNGLMAVANKTVKDGTNERVLLDNALKTPPTNKGKLLIMNFGIPLDIAKEMIRKNLESEAQKKIEKPNSTAQTVNSNANTGK